jgi:hypothetical protein
MRNLFPVAVAISILFFSCHKTDGTTEAPGTRLKQVITNQAVRDSNVFTFFLYNDNAQLIRVSDSFHVLTNNLHYLDTVSSYPFLYNPQGNLQKIDYREGSVYGALYDVRIYNGQNRLLENTRIDQYNNDTAVTGYRYDGSNRLIGDSTMSTGHPGRIEWSTYVYDDNDNIVKWQRILDSAGTILKLDSSEITYDANPNPYHSFGMSLYSLKNIEQVLSKNNIVQQRFSNGSVFNYQYAYFSNRYPKDVFVTVTSPNAIPNREFHFTYE